MSEAASSPIKEGDLLAGKYRVERVLGVGGMGIVVAARHEQLDQPVAIKFVREDALGNEQAVARFLREARACVKLRSDHAAKVLDVGTLESGAPYMVMEYLEGADLGAVLGEQGALSVETTAGYVVQACEALAEAHAAGIVHRDLKPQNLYLARTVGGEQRIKVLDFGVSKMLLGGGGAGNLTMTQSMLGSPLYMSPEQMRSSRDVDARTDVWALGVVIFELLTRRWPFEAETMPELCLRVTTEPPQSLTELRPDVPQAMLDVVKRCLSKDPADRFANAAELAVALEPLAPPELRSTVERARLAMGSKNRPRMVSVPEIAVAETPARPALTPAAWGSGRGDSPVTQARRSGGMWIGAGIAAAAVVAGAVLLVRGRDVPTPVPVISARVQAAPPPVRTLFEHARTEAAPVGEAGASSQPALAAPPAHPWMTAAGAPRAAAVVPAPSAAAAVAVAVSAAPAPAPAPKPNCDPPYVIDGAGNHQYKPECL